MMWFMITYMPMATALPVCVQKASETERVKLKGNALAAAAATDGAVRAAVQLISALNWLVVWCATRRFVLRYLFALLYRFAPLRPLRHICLHQSGPSEVGLCVFLLVFGLFD